jgi:hypothetical protein
MYQDKYFLPKKDSKEFRTKNSWRRLARGQQVFVVDCPDKYFLLLFCGA